MFPTILTTRSLFPARTGSFQLRQRPVMLPIPALSFTLPSLCDDTRLDCRIYHPECLTDPSMLDTEIRSWRKQAAVVAHPYAPLGGCYDDAVVDVVAGALLQVGYVVATFNFRGAQSSAGRTSWSSKPEQADYMSVVGFLAYYVHYLDAPSTVVRRPAVPPAPVLLQAGYSYGATVTTKLPPLDVILSQFASPAIQTAAADIRLRAQHLAEQQNALAATPLSPRRSLGMRVGGQEDAAPASPSRRRSHSYAHEEGIRKGVKELLARTRLIHIHRKHHRKLSQEEDGAEQVEQCMQRTEAFTAFRSAYLIVSPPFGILTSLATMTFSNSYSSSPKRPHRSRNRPPEAQDDGNADAGGAIAADDKKLVANPTLAVYGDQDAFLALKKMREWTAYIGNIRGSEFRYIEVSGAGHFWVEDRVMIRLRDAVGAFGFGLLRNQ